MYNTLLFDDYSRSSISKFVIDFISNIINTENIDFSKRKTTLFLNEEFKQYINNIIDKKNYKKLIKNLSVGETKSNNIILSVLKKRIIFSFSDNELYTEFKFTKNTKNTKNTKKTNSELTVIKKTYNNFTVQSYLSYINKFGYNMLSLLSQNLSDKISGQLSKNNAVSVSAANNNSSDYLVNAECFISDITQNNIIQNSTKKQNRRYLRLGSCIPKNKKYLYTHNHTLIIDEKKKNIRITENKEFDSVNDINEYINSCWYLSEAEYKFFNNHTNYKDTNHYKYYIPYKNSIYLESDCILWMPYLRNDSYFVVRKSDRKNSFTIIERFSTKEKAQEYVNKNEVCNIRNI